MAVLEELIGNHGGMGGEQTYVFLFHPGDMVVPETRNSIDVFGILNVCAGRRSRRPRRRSRSRSRVGGPGNLLKGIFHQPSLWFGRALRALVLDRSAYTEVADDSYMTGPALLITIVGLALATVFSPQGWSVSGYLGRLGGWLLGLVVLVVAAHPLGGRAGLHQDSARRGLRICGSLPCLLAAIPVIQPVAIFLTVVVTFFATGLARSRPRNCAAGVGLCSRVRRRSCSPSA